MTEEQQGYDKYFLFNCFRALSCLSYRGTHFRRSISGVLSNKIPIIESLIHTEDFKELIKNTEFNFTAFIQTYHSMTFQTYQKNPFIYSKILLQHPGHPYSRMIGRLSVDIETADLTFLEDDQLLPQAISLLSFTGTVQFLIQMGCDSTSMNASLRLLKENVKLDHYIIEVGFKAAEEEASFLLMAEEKCLPIVSTLDPAVELSWIVASPLGKKVLTPTKKLELAMSKVMSFLGPSDSIKVPALNKTLHKKYCFRPLEEYIKLKDTWDKGQRKTMWLNLVSKVEFVNQRISNHLNIILLKKQ